MSRRNELIDLCRREPEKVVDLLLALEAKVVSLEVRLNRTSKNSNKPPRQWSKSKRKPGGQKGHRGTTLKFSDQPDQISGMFSAVWSTPTIIGANTEVKKRIRPRALCLSIKVF